MFGDVYLNCPLNDEVLWFDWCDYETFQKKYIDQYDKGRFFWIPSK